MIGKTTTLLFTGARWHPNPEIATTALARYVLNEAPGWVVVRHGACPGDQSIDQAISEWIRDCGEALGVIEDPMPADWDNCGPGCPPYGIIGHRIFKRPGDVEHPGKLDTYCPQAGPRRNAEMVNKRPRADRAIAVPYGRSFGTRNCIGLAHAADIPTTVLTDRNVPAVLMEALF
jgi:hypothetical protein